MPTPKINKIQVMDYSPDKCEEIIAKKIEDCVRYKDTPEITWINIDNVPPISFLNELRLGFNLHPVVIDDILNTNQRPKIEILDDYIFLAIKMLMIGEKNKKVVSEQVSIILSHKFVITFQQGIAGDTFEPVRHKIRQPETRIRSFGADYLAYELMNSVVSNYFNILESFSDRIEKLESETASNPTPRTLNNIHLLKRQLINFRRSVWPLRELISMLERSESPLIKKTTRIYLRDLYEQLVQIIDTLETYRDIMSGLLDIYLSSISNRTNAIVKVLTIITTIFMPLSFLTGFYGMNFLHLPGLQSPAGPIVIVIIMLSVLTTMLGYFKHKNWL
ncbi:MAG: magnesium/cobalt transporter CorA [Patescibacteria group bacterium]